jgi:hypothetical protein
MPAPGKSCKLQSLESYPQGESNNAKNVGKTALLKRTTRAATHIGDERLETIIAAWGRLPEAVKDELARIATRAAGG